MGKTWDWEFYITNDQNYVHVGLSYSTSLLTVFWWTGKKDLVIQSDKAFTW